MFFNAILDFFDSYPFHDIEGNFCYTYAIDIFFKNEIMVGKNNNKASLNLSKKIYDNLFSSIACLKYFDNLSDEEYFKLFNSQVLHLLKCIYLGIINKLLEPRFLEEKLSIFFIIFETFLLLNKNFIEIESLLIELISASINPKYYNEASIQINRGNCIAFLNKIMVQLNDKTCLLYLNLDNFIKKLENSSAHDLHSLVNKR